MDKDDSRLRRTRQARLKITELNIARPAAHHINLHIYAQAFSENGAEALASALAAEAEVRKGLSGNGGSIAVAALVGKCIVEKVKVAGIEAVTFSRSGFRCHDHVKALANMARETGLKF